LEDVDLRQHLVEAELVRHHEPGERGSRRPRQLHQLVHTSESARLVHEPPPDGPQTASGRTPEPRRAMTDDPDAFARRLAADSISQADPTGWFDRLYAAADAGRTRVPWDRGAPHPLLVEWGESAGMRGPGRALVVGCGLGSDAEYVADLGF